MIKVCVSFVTRFFGKAYVDRIAKFNVELVSRGWICPEPFFYSSRSSCFLKAD